MKKIIAFVFVLAFTASVVNAVETPNKKDVIGEWKYEVPTAPYGYSSGTFVISEKEGKLAGHVKFSDGYKIDLKDVTYEEDTLKFGLYIDYSYVSLKSKIEGQNMNGTVNTPEGDMKVTAKKVK